MNDRPDREPEADDIELIAEPGTAVAEGPDPADDPALAVIPWGRPSLAPRRCFLALGAVHDMLGHGQTEPRREVGGILLGSFVRSPRGPATCVTDIIPALLADAGITHMTFTHDTWTQIHDDLQSRDGGLRMVGWYHTHPGFGPFFSAHDSFIHRNFFTEGLHVGVVLDPVQNMVSVYGWAGGEVVRVPGCLVYAPVSEVAELRDLVQRVSYVADRSPSVLEKIARRLGEK